MTTSDPIADMLTRIRNANTAKHDTVDVPASKMKIAIADILVDEGYIAKYDIVEDGNFKTMRITLKYGADKNEKIITGLKRISKPGLRVYAGKDELPRVLGGLGIAILSTNQGIITDKEARKLQVGGEVLAFVWTDKIGRTKGWFFREHLPGASVSGLSRSNVAFGSSGLLNLEEVLTESGNYGASRNDISTN